MATLDSLKQALRGTIMAAASSQKQPLSNTQYSAGFDLLLQGPGWTTYQEFIIPQLARLLAPLFNSRFGVSVLEIGPGPKSVLGHLPNGLKRKIRKYTAFEPNDLFADGLEEWLCSTSKTELPMPCLESPPAIHRVPFTSDSTMGGDGTGTGDEKFDIVLFCHSMYGMNPKRKFIEQAFDMLVEQPDDGMVVVFHRDGTLYLDGLVCHQTASFPAGVVHVPDTDEALDVFAPFLAGFVMENEGADRVTRAKWREVCRDLGKYEEFCLSFGAPAVMAAFTRHATALPELTAQVPVIERWNVKVKNREAKLHRPAAIVRPTEIQHVQECVRWAIKHRFGLTVIGGSHGGHCLRPNVVALDMGAFDQVRVLKTGNQAGGTNRHGLVVAEAGCKTGDIIREATSAGVTVPLGARPSVGAGLWLQGGIGHLARLHGLACDAIVGAVLVSVDSGQLLYVGRVPAEHLPPGAERPQNEADLLWALKGAGTNFGIVISVTFEAFPAPMFDIRNRVYLLRDSLEAKRELAEFDLLAGKLPPDCSADAYLYWEKGQLRLGVTTLKPFRESSATGFESLVLGQGNDMLVRDAVGLFSVELYVTTMHGGHGRGKTSSFKRCLFLKDIGAPHVVERLVAALDSRPSPLCYLHLVHGGGAVRDVPKDATAFGCRDWDLACVVTGVWPREHDGTGFELAGVRWVYKVLGDLLPLSSGVYGADLGPDPRDAALAARAFGLNRPRLARIKRSADPHNLLAYACPLPKPPKLIILVSGDCGAGKDYCGGVWASVFNDCADKHLTARVMSISDSIKRQYAAAVGANPSRLLGDRAYKEEHRPALTRFYQDSVRERPSLPVETFLDVVYDAGEIDMLVVTGMRDEAPVAALSPLVPDSRMLEVRVQARGATRQARRGCDDDGVDNKGKEGVKESNNIRGDSTPEGHRPSFIFDNDKAGEEAARAFAEKDLLAFFHDDLQRLDNMVRAVPGFPRPGICFRHVLNIVQQQGGLALCTSLLQARLAGDWTKVDRLVSCEVGGLLFAPALAVQVDVRLVPIREAGKLPPPTVSVRKGASHIASSAANGPREKMIEMDRDAIPSGASVVVVDDVLATGETLVAVLELLGKVGVSPERISVLVVAEFSFHCGRELLRKCGFGRVNVQSLLVFGGA